MVASALAASAAAPTSATAAVSPTPAAFALTAVGSHRRHAAARHGRSGAARRGSRAQRLAAANHRHLAARRHQKCRQRQRRLRHHRALAYRPLAASRGGTVRLAPHASRRIAFTVSIPAGTIGASHYAGIVAINAADLATGGARKGATGTSFTFYRINRQALPLTIRLPGPLTRSLALRFAKLIVAPVGARLHLALRAGGSELIEAAQLNVRVLRGSRTIFTYASTLGQLFPTTSLNYDVPWQGRPTPGSYRVLGTIRPTGTAPVNIDTTVKFTGANATQLKRETPAVPGAATNGLPGWVPITLTIATVLMIALSLAVYKLARRPAKTVE